MIKQIVFWGAVFMFLACKTTTMDSSPASSTAMCVKSCDDQEATPEMLGCVVSCDKWKSTQVKVNVGESLYGASTQQPSCKFVYEKRDADQVQAGSFYQAFNFQLSLSNTFGDGSFYALGSGLVDAGQILDFSKDGDIKEVGEDREDGLAQIIFKKVDPENNGFPTLTAFGSEPSDRLQKSLVVVMEKGFDPQKPFAHVKTLHFVEKMGDIVKYDVTCSRE